MSGLFEYDFEKYKTLINRNERIKRRHLVTALLDVSKHIVQKR